MFLNDDLFLIASGKFCSRTISLWCGSKTKRLFKHEKIYIYPMYHDVIYR